MTPTTPANPTPQDKERTMTADSICYECHMLTKPHADGGAEYHPWSYCEYYKQASDKRTAAEYLHELATTRSRP